MEKRVFDVGWLPEDGLPLSVLINVYAERQVGDLLTASLFTLKYSGTCTLTPKGILSLSATHTYT